MGYLMFRMMVNYIASFSDEPLEKNDGILLDLSDISETVIMGLEEVLVDFLV